MPLEIIAPAIDAELAEVVMQSNEFKMETKENKVFIFQKIARSPFCQAKLSLFDN